MWWYSIWQDYIDNLCSFWQVPSIFLFIIYLDKIEKKENNFRGTPSKYKNN